MANDINTTVGARPRELDSWKLRHTFSEFGINFRIATLLRIVVAAGMLVASTLPLVAAGDSEDGGLSDLNGLGDGGPSITTSPRGTIPT